MTAEGVFPGTIALTGVVERNGELTMTAEKRSIPGFPEPGNFRSSEEPRSCGFTISREDARARAM